MVVESKKVLDLLDSKGCIVDYNTQLVKFPAKVVEDCLAKIPATNRGTCNEIYNSPASTFVASFIGI